MKPLRLETREQEDARMAEIAKMKAVLDAAAAPANGDPDLSSHLGRQIASAMSAAASVAREKMRSELVEHYFRTTVAPPKDPSTHLCLNTGLPTPCLERLPKRRNCVCDLCGNYDGKL